MSPTLNVNPTLFVIPCNFLFFFVGGEILDLQCCNYHHLPNDSLIQILIIHDNISSQVVEKRRWGFGQWMNSSITHDNLCQLIHKKCHPKSYHSDMKCHMTLDIVFRVVLRDGTDLNAIETPPLLHRLALWLWAASNLQVYSVEKLLFIYFFLFFYFLFCWDRRPKLWAGHKFDTLAKFPRDTLLQFLGVLINFS